MDVADLACIDSGHDPLRSHHADQVECAEDAELRVGPAASDLGASANPCEAMARVRSDAQRLTPGHSPRVHVGYRLGKNPRS